MLVTLFITLAAVCCSTNGHPFEASKSTYDSNYFLNSRIVGGIDAPDGYGRHMAALVFGKPWVFFVCGGSIITSKHILTAAHCIDVSLTWDKQLIPSFRAIIGTKMWSNGSNEVQFNGYTMHSGWDWDTIKYDIGILSVVENIQTSDSVAIIPLKFDWVDGGTKSYVTGWGSVSNPFSIPETLQLLYVRTLSHQECHERMLEAINNLGPAPPVQRDIEICTLYSPGHGMCNGDSGSALVKEDTQEQIGIVSWGFPCAHGAPDVFARISGFEGWLRGKTQGHLT